MKTAPSNSIRDRQLGLTLVEVMVAMAISLGMIGALVSLVVNNSRTGAEIDRAARQTENGRYAMDVLTNELRLAGFYGELAVSGLTYATANPCEINGADLGFDAGGSPTAPVSIQGMAGTVADPAPGCATNHVLNTGVIAIRRVATATTPAVAASLTANDMYLQTSRCDSDPSGTPFVFSTDADDFDLKALDCVATAPVRRYVGRTYFVASCNDCGKDTIPTLKRTEFDAGAITLTPIAEGIQEVQFEYGFDTDGNGSPDEYRTGLSGVAAAANNDWGNVMAVRIWLLTRSTEPSPGYKDEKEYRLGVFGARGPFNDAFKRRAYSQVVRLNNPAGQRE